jgi:hypothetical protein
MGISSAWIVLFIRKDAIHFALEMLVLSKHLIEVIQRMNS